MKALARNTLEAARRRGSIVRQQTQVKGERPAPEPISLVGTPGSGSRLMYLEGRRHALAIVSDGIGLLSVTGGKTELMNRLRHCSKGKPGDFARGILDVADELEALT